MDKDDRQKTRDILVKPVKDYTQEESDFMDRMMRTDPVGFAEVLEEEVQALRALALSLRAKQNLRASDSD